MAFDHVIGHDTPKARLMDALVGDRMAHAYLFHGPPGTGAEALAIELAKAVNCESGTGEPCQQCRTCRKIGALQHPDVHIYPPSSSARSTRTTARTGEEAEGVDDRGGRRDARTERREELLSVLVENPYAALPLRKSDYISIDDIRELRQEAGITPFEGHRKVVIIVAADRMNTAASNALLKTLEEPPGTLLLILISYRIHQLLPTIVSRCQPLHLARLPDQVLFEALTHKFQIEPAQAQLAIRQADGSISQALTSASKASEIPRSTAFLFLEKVLMGTFFELFEAVERLVASHKDTPVVEEILDILLGCYRDLFLLVTTGDDTAIQHIDKGEWLADMARQLTFEQVESAITTIEEMKQNIIRNVHIQLALTVLALRLRACVSPIV